MVFELCATTSNLFDAWWYVGTSFIGPASLFSGSSCELGGWTAPHFEGTILAPHWSGEYQCSSPVSWCWLLPVGSSSWAISRCLQQMSWIPWGLILLSISQGEPVLLLPLPGCIFLDPFLQCWQEWFRSFLWFHHMVLASHWLGLGCLDPLLVLPIFLSGFSSVLCHFVPVHMSV